MWLCVCVYISQKIILNEPQSDSRILNGETTDFGGHQSEIKRCGNLGKPGGNRQPGETSGNLGETTEFLQNHLALHGSQAPPPQGRPPPKTTWCAVGFTRFAPTKMGHWANKHRGVILVILVNPQTWECSMGTSWNTLGISQQMDIMRVDLMVLYPVIKHGWNILYQRVLKSENHRILDRHLPPCVHHITKFPA